MGDRSAATCHSGFAPSHASLSRPIGECQAQWVEALCAFYEADCLPQKAWNIRHGAPLDHLDRRAIDALKAAFEKAPE